MRTIEEIQAGGRLRTHEFDVEQGGPRYQAALLIHDGDETYALIDTERLDLIMLPSMETEHGHLEFRHLAAAADAMNQRHNPALDHNGAERFICEVRETVDGPAAFVTDTTRVTGFGYATWLLFRLLPDDEMDANFIIAAARWIADCLNRLRYDYFHRLDPRSWTYQQQRELLASEFGWAATPFAAEWEALLAA